MSRLTGLNIPNTAPELAGHPGEQHRRLLIMFNHSKDILATNFFFLTFLIESLEDRSIQTQLGGDKAAALFKKTDGELIAHLHNYLASVMTFIEHTRALQKCEIITDEHRDLLKNKVEETFVRSDVARFTQDFRNYMVHYGFPIIIHHNVRSKSLPYYIQLNCEELLDWNGWTAKSKTYIKEASPQMRLITPVLEYKALLLPYLSWFAQDYVTRYSGVLDEYRELEKTKGLPKIQEMPDQE